MLKMAFSTLGCPDWDFEDILSTAKDLGYDAIEVRGIGRELHAPAAKPFQPEYIENTKAKLQNLGLTIACFTSSVRLNEDYRIESHMQAGREYIELAAKMGVPYVRVMPDSGPEVGHVVFHSVAERLVAIADYAAQYGVTILVENNGAFAKSSEMLKLMETVGRSNVKVLWDVNHPVRNFGETPQETWNTLKEYIRYLLIKDSVDGADGTEYRMIGDGDLPLKEIVDLLKAADFDGYLSLEWLKRWCLSLAEPGIVFPQYVNYMKTLAK